MPRASLKLGTRWVTIPRSRMERTEQPGGGVTFTRRPDGFDTAQVTIAVDLDALFDDLAKRALGNKTGKAAIAFGAVEARVVSDITHTEGKI